MTYPLMQSHSQAAMAPAESFNEAYYLIYDYVTFGQWRDDTQFDEHLGRLGEIIARPTRPFTLHRVINLLPDQVRLLQEGHPVTLAPRRFSSWTSDKTALKRLAAQRRRPATISVTVERTFPGSAVLVDVRSFYKHHGLDNSDVEEWGLYVSWEHEVIVEDPAPLVLSLSDISAFLDPSPAFAAPEPGDCFINSSGDEEEVKWVAADQPDASRGIFLVRSCYGESVYLRGIDHGVWEEITHSSL